MIGMFTGIISDVGQISGLEQLPGADRRFVIDCGYDSQTLTLGASVCCAGCCLTVTGSGARENGAWFSAEVSNETLARTSLGGWSTGTRVNLERALTLADELGGHLVSGHVDATAALIGRRDDGASERLTFEAPQELAGFIAEKGSVCLDGTSLTVNEVDGARFGVNLIAHTLKVTTWDERRPGDMVNLEVDLLARYVARLMQAGNDGK